MGCRPIGLVAVLACACASGSVRNGPNTTSVGESGDSQSASSAADGGACVPGQQIACACPNGGTGAQACEPDGSGYGPCDCPGDGDTDGATTGTTAPGTTASDSSAAGSSSGAGSGESASDPDVQVCLDEAASDAEQCECENCIVEHQACLADEGCTAIRECAILHMCAGIRCLDQCGAEIDQYGGITGNSAMLANVLSTCVQNACMAG